MATSNSKRTEETATTALKSALLRCPILEAYIDSNDRTPSWDGTVFVYKNENHKKDNLLGRAPIQVKGTEKANNSDSAVFSCQVADLRNYYRDGGCVFFFINVNLLLGTANIYYLSLQVFDLKKLLDDAGKQKTITIRLKEFPTESISEIAAIFMDFVENSRKQASFVEKEIYSPEQLEKSGIEIESFSFNTSGCGLNMDNIGSFISTHDFYLYAKPKGLDIDIPVEKVSNAIVSKMVSGKVSVRDKEYFSKYSVLYKKGEPVLHMGKGISISLNQQNKKVTVNFRPSGTLSDFIQDAPCFIDMMESQEITINGARFRFAGISKVALDSYKESLNYYKDVKKMLDVLGVVEELQCEKLTDKDENNIRLFVNAVLYNRRLDFPDAKEDIVHGSIKIANLSIWIWAIKQEDGYYQLENFFDSHRIVLFESDDKEQSNPIPASHYLLLNKDAFIHASNMNYELISAELFSMEHQPMLVDYITIMLLNILRAYDEQKQKDQKLLELADGICNWISAEDKFFKDPILRLNQLQITKRCRTLTTQEIIELGKYADDKQPIQIRCGAYLLLEDSVEAQKCFDELSQEMQKEFLTFPICHFGNLIQEGTR
ncbi:MAG: hypothetical protein IJM91_07465 [Lachnospiraceae bacterium]|nr:hypothetical protein [Lachnospiraceae bacterium]